jgi:hypothetical protein
VAAEESANDRESVYQFFCNICESNAIQIPEDERPAFFELHRQSRLWCSFVKDTIAIGAISIDSLRLFIQNCVLSDATTNFLSLAHDFIYKINDREAHFRSISHLPLEKESVP